MFPPHNDQSMTTLLFGSGSQFPLSNTTATSSSRSPHSSSGTLSLPDSVDPFADTLPPARPRIPQPFFNSYQQGAYTPDSHLQMLSERCHALEMQLAKVTTERDTMCTLYDKLAGSVKLDPPSEEPKTHPTPETHPRIRFWKYDDFMNWLDTPAAQITSRGQLPYLEDTDGGSINESRVKIIRKTVRRGMSELVDNKLAPQTWGRLSASGHEKFRKVVETDHALFLFDADGWKLDHLASSMYPAWRKAHLNEKCEWLTKAEKLARQAALAGSSEVSPSMEGKKRRKDNLPDNKVSKKAKKETVPSLERLMSPERLPSPKPSSSPERALFVPLTQQERSPSPPNSPQASPPPNSPLASPPPKKPEHAPSPIKTPGESSTQADKENQSPKQPPPPPKKKLIANPLSAMSLHAANAAIPPLPTPPVIDPALEEAADDQNDSKKKGCKSYRPSSTKNGRNLCAFRWLKQIKKGSSAEFKVYYDALTSSQHLSYKEEANRLNTDGLWTSHTVAVICDGHIY
ncbi:hypothetical protein HYDPIDRAFT_118174 [Hydnomerulius pinastri MD-312]|uniref:Uncharacterized protein n=1 Tax=Hydnomerulius pinastri MD-312 TaxID=994086 RepID=A0A0C9VPV5_9AGAM|nr:hypothetical protein HYDPIDRAFT_118174 [Hydnomerulius pinastri MD-312]